MNFPQSSASLEENHAICNLEFERRLLIHFFIPEGSLSSHLDDSCSLVNPGTLELVLAVHRCDAIGLKVLVGAAFF